MQVVAAIKKGNEIVFRQVFNENHEKLYYYILSKTRSVYLAEEVVQITFIKIWNNRATLNEDYTISTHIFRIATTSLIDLLRKQNNAISLLRRIEDADNKKFSNDTFESIDVKEKKKQLLKAIEQMPPIRQKIFKMSRLEELSYNEIASELSISVKTVESHMTKAIKQLRHLIFVLLIIIGSLFFFK